MSSKVKEAIEAINSSAKFVIIDDSVQVLLHDKGRDRNSLTFLCPHLYQIASSS